MLISIEVVRESISTITKILSGKGIKVTQSGTQAYVESEHGVPKRVNIPYIPDNASEELILAINGFLDHEVAHVLFTDFKASTRDKFKNQTVFSIYNAIEDCRIEREMRNKFPGSKANLNGVSSFFIDKYVQPEFDKCLESKDPKAIMSSLFVAAVRAWFGQDIFANYMKDKWSYMDDLSARISSQIPELPSIVTTEEAVKMAHVIYELMADREEKKQERKQEEKETGGKGKKSEEKGEEGPKEDKSPVTYDEDDAQEQDKEDESESEDEPEQESEGESEQEGEDDQQDDDQSEQDEPGDFESSEGQSDDDGDDSEESEDESSEDGGGDEGDGDGNSDEEGDDSESGDSPKEDVVIDISDIIKPPETSGMAESVADVISRNAVDSARALDYRIFSSDFDVVERFDNAKHSTKSERTIDLALKKIDEEVKKLSGPLQKTLERLVKAKSVVRNIPGKRSGRVNPSSLFRLKTGDERVFRQRDVGISSEVAVSLVVDCSGSMHGQKMNVAMESAFALCDVLTKIGISNEVIGFTTSGGDEYYAMLEALTAEADKLRKDSGSIRYSRNEPLFMPIFKGFDERFGTEQKRRIAAASKSGDFMRNNVDGECIRIAAKRLVSMTREKGKQMIVLSDGSPCAYGDTREVMADTLKAVSDIESMGVKVIGIGIMDDSVKKFYKNHIVINNVQELPTLIIKELRELLL